MKTPCTILFSSFVALIKLYIFNAIIVFFGKVISPVKTGKIIDLKITISSNSFLGSKLSLITLCLL